MFKFHQYKLVVFLAQTFVKIRPNFPRPKQLSSQLIQNNFESHRKVSFLCWSHHKQISSNYDYFYDTADYKTINGIAVHIKIKYNKF